MNEQCVPGSLFSAQGHGSEASVMPLSCPPNVPSLQETGSIDTNELETGLLQLISREGYCKLHKVSNISQGYC